MINAEMQQQAEEKLRISWEKYSAIGIPHSESSNELYDIGVALEEVDAFLVRSYDTIRAGKKIPWLVLKNCKKGLLEEIKKLESFTRVDVAMANDKKQLQIYVNTALDLVSDLEIANNNL